MSSFLQRGCFKKRPFATREEAHAAQPKMRVYRCPLCDRYHTRSKISRRQVSGR